VPESARNEVDTKNLRDRINSFPVAPLGALFRVPPVRQFGPVGPAIESQPVHGIGGHAEAAFGTLEVA
jgi:hypothetical protein